MKKLLAVVCLCLLSLSAQAALDQIVAIVNDEVILQSQWEAKVALAKRDYPLIEGKEELALRQKMLNDLIDVRLQLQLASLANITADDADVKKAIANIAEKNQLTVDELYENLQIAGIDKTFYQQSIRDQLVISRLLNAAVGNKITVSDEAIDTFLIEQQRDIAKKMQFRLSQILIPVADPKDKASLRAARELSQKMLADVKRGVEFDQLILNYGHIQQTDLGWRTFAELPDIYKPAVRKMAVGDVQGPIQAGNGMQLLKLTQTRNPAVQHLSKKAQREQAENILYQQQLQQAAEAWLQAQRESAYIKIYAKG